ncbi:hypothetical protein BDK88_0039 [Natrinema hispanicum]|uniref:Uncharacterized protein n=1 Tax=Natrinema hispanicum TaxID=392421 RepID=A0A482YI67_9EURY|nr:hypothetical protein BDK88_0039 [Natrinema hispanicum]
MGKNRPLYMEVRHTAPVKLVIPDERRDDLHETARQFLHCANHTSESCWSNDSYTPVNEGTHSFIHESNRDQTPFGHAHQKAPSQDDPLERPAITSVAR